MKWGMNSKEKRKGKNLGKTLFMGGEEIDRQIDRQIDKQIDRQID